MALCFGRFCAHFGGDVVAMRYVEQIGNFSQQVVFVRADDSVGVGDLPHVFDDAVFFGPVQFAIDAGSELLKIVGGFCRVMSQFG